MYKFSEPNTDQVEIFEKSLPFGDTLNRDNRWIRLAGLIGWQRFELIYAQTFSTTGRPGIRARYVLGSLILKHKLQISDEELLLQLYENPYLQYFIGLEKFSQEIPFDASTLTNVRGRLGDNEFKEFEKTIIDELVEKKILQPRNLQIDATVFESDITYPTDCGLLNKASASFPNAKVEGQSITAKLHQKYLRQIQERGNPTDTSYLPKTINNIEVNFKLVPDSIATDGGYASIANRDYALSKEIKNIVFNKIKGPMQNIASSQ